jgi:hypothetical protein
LWYRSVTLRHIISLLDQIEGIAKVGLNSPAYFKMINLMRRFTVPPCYYLLT